MYSGTTFRTKSGRVIGVHQKIDRIARRHLKAWLPRGYSFPTAHDILHFEGANGPDGIKRKSPAVDEPWHYVDPANPDDRALISMIDDHMYNMSQALKDGNQQRAAFEAAWMAHAIVDGLTPAHHYPLDEKIEELWGKPREQRLTVRDKNIIRGKTKRETLTKNWEYWGARGVFTNHFMFEWGVATAIVTQTFDNTAPSSDDYAILESNGFEAYFIQVLHHIAAMNMYDEFSHVGWTRHLAQEARNTLVPLMIKAVVMGWYQAVQLADKK